MSSKCSVSMKLLIDSQGKRVLFAEASKDCVDFLFHILAMPIANVINLLKKQGMVGSLGNLFESLENLNESYIQPNKTKDTLLRPVVQVFDSSVPKLLLLNDAPPIEKKLYMCSSRCNYNVTDDPRTICLSCNGCMNAKVEYVARIDFSLLFGMHANTPERCMRHKHRGVRRKLPEKKVSYVAPPVVDKVCEERGIVKGVVTYMIMDDLVVNPMSTISSITLLNKLNVKEVGALEEKVVKLGMDEAVKLLKASFQSQNVLTDVFLKRT